MYHVEEHLIKRNRFLYDTRQGKYTTNLRIVYDEVSHTYVTEKEYSTKEWVNDWPVEVAPSEIIEVTITKQYTSYADEIIDSSLRHVSIRYPSGNGGLFMVSILNSNEEAELINAFEELKKIDIQLKSF